MITNSLTFRFVAILSVLTILNIMFVGVSWHRKEEYACSVDTVLEGVAKYLHANGRRKLTEEFPESCRKSGPSSQSAETLNVAIKNAVSVCESKRSLVKNLSNPIVTLFTTWPNETSDTKKTVHNITLNNWLSFKAKVRIVIFTNDTKFVRQAETLGVHTFPVVAHAGGGAPVLRVMFETVLKHFHSSHLYGYVNSDILFTKGFIDTLEYILNLRRSKSNSPFLVIGKRTNVLNVTSAEASSYSGIEATAKARGVLFSPNAEDFFITNREFPWSQIVDVVVGRVAYDNWLVGHVICNLHIDVIDVTQTVLAVHQTTNKGGNFEGFQHKDAHYNDGLFKKLGIKPVYETGFTLCAKEWTYRTLCGDIDIGKRDSFWDKCKCQNSSATNSRKL